MTMKSSKPISPIPVGSIDQILKDEGLIEGNVVNEAFKRSKGLSCFNVLGKFM